MSEARARQRFKLSAGFLASLAGIAITLLGWYGPWAWPAAPAFALLHVLFPRGESWTEIEYPARAAVLLLLIAVNVGTWALVLRVVVDVTGRLARRK